ncbi:LssY C-terminal domain-containing protein [Brachybacterium sp. J144]|uniref:LssY C-terminal domain-containing protein n=1 Tax=Brachybacterium sp. J144 TaxID=3116487 RepID=UPI002E7A4076|nr:LssY C-terminal domain-containing protein [Brachybacterium sp. J144]MEE1650502.1 LssY C-terminal domain-containing protein [Brachybacterium sp. J144]
MTPARTARLAPLDRPVPDAPPEYDHALGHTAERRRFELYGLLDTLFIVAGVVVSIWLALLYLIEGFSLTPVRLLYLVLFWLLLTYITLPRLHQLMTWIYLPDYFFGRTRTTEGVLSDPINIALDGAERDVHVAMRRAGWVLAEERTLSSAWQMVRSTLLRRSYPSAPVSDLYLMGRRHDFTYQQEVGGTTEKRHHVRFWRMPPDFVLPGGYRTDWLAAGTYDRAVGFSFFTLQITHRIDENIDVERDYLIDTVRFADPRIEVEVIEEFSTAYHDRNGQGDRFRTDGHLPVIDVEGAAARSDGATAMMLPRHRPTGTTVMKARARAATQSALAAARRRGPQEIGDELSAQWHGTVDDVYEVFARAADHHLPPPTVVFTGMLVLLQLGILTAEWVDRLAGVDLLARIPDVSLLLPSPEGLILLSVVAVVQVLLMVGVLRRSRWARIALMSLFTADAVGRLLLASATLGDVAHSLLVGAGASALGVLAISSDASRQWVQTLRLPSREPGADQGGSGPRDTGGAGPTE